MQILEAIEPYLDKINELEDEIVKLKTLAENRGAFIDFVLNKYPDIAKDYIGF